MPERTENRFFCGFHRGFKDHIDIFIKKHLLWQYVPAAVVRHPVGGGKSDGNVTAAIAAVRSCPPKGDGRPLGSPLQLAFVERNVSGQENDDGAGIFRGFGRF